MSGQEGPEGCSCPLCGYLDAAAAAVHAAQVPKGLLCVTCFALYERRHTGEKLSLTCQRAAFELCKLF